MVEACFAQLTMIALSRNPNPMNGMADAKNTIFRAAAVGAALLRFSMNEVCASMAAWNSDLRCQVGMRNLKLGCVVVTARCSKVEWLLGVWCRCRRTDSFRTPITLP